ncbi:MAG: hypothetical protein JO287_01075 [Pseudonocardiales bacterium]|nr:hypothetical protein [Pseudonocardiales bacterium]
MATTEGAQPAQRRPGRSDGVASEFAVFCKIKPGHAEALRELFTGLMNEFATNRAAINEIGTLHDARHAIFDNDTRLMFASVFDGPWDTYIDDFATTSVGESFDKIFSHTEGFPGVTDPNVKEWFVSQQEPALVFVSAYPDLTVKQIWKNQRVNEAFQAVLDTPEFRAALDNPANKALLATPAFQKLLDEAAG